MGLKGFDGQWKVKLRAEGANHLVNPIGTVETRKIYSRRPSRPFHRKALQYRLRRTTATWLAEIGPDR